MRASPRRENPGYGYNEFKAINRNFILGCFPVPSVQVMADYWLNLKENRGRGIKIIDRECVTSAKKIREF